MKQLILTIVCVLATASLSAQQSYEDYCRQMKEWYGLTLRFPAESVNNIGKEQPATMSNIMFANMQEAGGNVPIISIGQIVKLDEYCTLILADVTGNKPAPKRLRPFNEADLKNHRPYSEIMMLCNCGLPWFHLDHSYEILNDEQWMSKINTARDLYSHLYTVGRMVTTTNSRAVGVVRIPQVSKLNSFDQTTNAWLHEQAFGCCYGIDFYRPDNSLDFAVLMFIKHKPAKSVTEYLDELTQYIRFDPDFKLE